MSSTLPHKIYLVKRCYNVAATFVSNEHTVIIEQSTRDLKTLLQRCKNVGYYSSNIDFYFFISIFNIFVFIICLYRMISIDYVKKITYVCECVCARGGGVIINCCYHIYPNVCIIYNGAVTP